MAVHTAYKVSIIAIGSTNYANSGESNLISVTTNKTFTVTYNYNGATGENSTSSAPYITAASALTLPSPTKTGYSFAGWFSDTGFASKVGGAGGSYSPSGSNASITLYARWTAISSTDLLLHVDAANPASYSGSGTTWTDLSSNENDLKFPEK